MNVMEARIPREDADDVITLTIPNDSRWVGLLRLTAAGIASELDLTAEDLDDLKLAVTEACRHAMAACAPGGSVTVEFLLSTRSVQIDFTHSGPREPGVPAGDEDSDVSLFVLRAIADSVELHGSGGYRLGVRKTFER